MAASPQNGALHEVIMSCLQGAKFHNFQNFPVEVYWDDGSEHGVLQENISAMSSGEGHTTFEGHTFEFPSGTW